MKTLTWEVGRREFTGHWLASWLVAVVVVLLTVPSSQAAEVSGIAGVTEPLLDVTLSAAVSGIVANRRFREGDSVKEGDVLIELDKRLEELEVERRKVVLEARRIDYEATAKLFQTTKGTSKEELEKKESDFKLAVVEHAMAVEQLRRRTVTAPLSGTIVELPLEIGESCQPYQPLARVVAVRQCYFIAYLEARAAATLKMDQQVQLEVESGAGVETVAGTIAFLSPVADPASGLVKVKALFENPEGKARAGLAGRLHLK